jgi:RimJ/RimL family protein N-acetyltransferase
MAVVIETKRLSLRRFTIEDAAFALELVNDPAWLRFIGDRGVRTIDDARGYIGKVTAMYERYGFGSWVVELKTDGSLIGTCGIIKRDTLPEVDLGLAFLPQYRGQGFAYEAAAATLACGRDQFGLKRILAIVSPDNVSSIRLLVKLGMKQERLIRMPGADADVNLMAMEL